MMAAMRDKLIHRYFQVNWKIVWNVLISEIPILVAQIEKILQDVHTDSWSKLASSDEEVPFVAGSATPSSITWQKAFARSDQESMIFKPGTLKKWQSNETIVVSWLKAIAAILFGYGDGLGGHDMCTCIYLYFCVLAEAGHFASIV